MIHVSECASDLSWRPGAYPQMVYLDGIQYAYCGQEFDLEGDLCAFIYQNATGQRQLTVFND